jgi:hypothetical protein
VKDWRVKLFPERKEFPEGRAFPNLLERGDSHFGLGEGQETFSRKGGLDGDGMPTIGARLSPPLTSYASSAFPPQLVEDQENGYRKIYRLMA